MYIGLLHVKYPLFLSYFNQTWILPTDLRKKYLNINFHENQSSGSTVVQCGRTDVMELIVAFRNFANAPKNEFNLHYKYSIRTAQ